MRGLIVVLTLALIGCAEAGMSGQPDPKATYRLVEIDGETFQPRATIRFEDADTVRGEAPCNVWFASRTASDPQFALGPIAASLRACPDMNPEVQFFEALGTMTLIEVEGTLLTLSNEDGREMVFEAE